MEHAGAADARHLDHLERLAERNRTARMRKDHASERKEALLRSREAGFDVCWSGANHDRVEQRKLERERQQLQNQLRLLHKRKGAAGRPAQQAAAPQAAQQQASAPSENRGAQRGVWEVPVEPAALRLPEATARRGWGQKTVMLLDKNGAQLRLRPDGPDGREQMAPVGV